MKKLVFLVDSDGTVMDTMTFKHNLFFCPVAIEVFGVDKKDQATFTENWAMFNLYSKTRGINRFEGLVKGLESINYNKIDISNLSEWVRATKSLSNESLIQLIKKEEKQDLELALIWSNKVNEKLSAAEGLDKPFENSKAALQAMEALGEVYIVSSANHDAVLSEWTNHNLIEHVDGVYCQDKGTKSGIIKILQGKIPDKEFILLGDAISDMKAAYDNNIHFYPMLVGKENESWTRYLEETLIKLQDNKFDSNYQKELEYSFLSNFV